MLVSFVKTEDLENYCERLFIDGYLIKEVSPIERKPVMYYNNDGGLVPLPNSEMISKWIVTYEKLKVAHKK